MMLRRVRVYTYRLPLRAPLRLPHGVLTERTGWLLELVDDAGRTFRGEAAPLPGFSPETSEEAEAALLHVARRLASTTLSDDWLPLSPALASLLDEVDAPPSVRFAAETAVWSLLAGRRGQNLATLLADAVGRAPDDAVVVNTLVIGDTPEETADAARQSVQDNYPVVKMKVGRRPLADDLARTEAVWRALNGRAILRLDANRAWSLAEAEAFLDGVRERHIEIAYVEEPLADADDLASLDAPVALDETLTSIEPDALGGLPNVRAVVLKPTLLGLERALRFGLAAQQRGLDAVLSAAFEAGVAMQAHVALTAALGGTVPAGLDPYRRLAQDVLAPRLRVGPRLDVREVLHTPRSLQHVTRLLDLPTQ